MNSTHSLFGLCFNLQEPVFNSPPSSLNTCRVWCRAGGLSRKDHCSDGERDEIEPLAVLYPKSLNNWVKATPRKSERNDAVSGESPERYGMTPLP